jgi:hypothetical protein
MRWHVCASRKLHVAVLCGVLLAWLLLSRFFCGFSGSLSLLDSRSVNEGEAAG